MTESIGHHIGLINMIFYHAVIIFEQLNPSTLSKIQLLLSNEVLEALVINVDDTPFTVQIVPPDH